jgi:carboxypeptidase family protein
MTRTSIVAIVALALAAAFPDRVSSQSPTGTISGVVTDPDGAVFPGAFVQARGARAYNEASDDAGKYRLQVVPGTYDLSINVPGMKGFQRKGVVVQANQNVVIDARLEDTASLRTLGEDPASIAARFFTRPEPPKGRTPRLTNRKPDLSGMWLSGPADLDTLPMLPWAAALAKERSDAGGRRTRS